ncbi:MAG: 4Fe-4S binding protein [Thermodesulfobacteriota bacterium]|nr:4Fe-4S binding protein [Thermodesulfobacteriota bacterium]
MTVLLFIPWFGGFTSAVFGFEAEFETEIAVMLAFLLFGPLWCGWICPFGNLSYFISRAGAVLFPNIQITIPEKADRPLRYLKYVILVIFIYVIITHRFDYFFTDHMEMYFSTEFTTFFIKFKKYAIMLIPLLIPRFFCKYLCFQKAMYNIINRFLPFTSIHRNTDQCVECRKCDKACPMGINISTMDSIKGKDCIGCFSCVDEKVCPSKVNAMELRFLGKKIKPLKFAAIVIPVYYLTTWLVLYI